jgi:hypothetical protein
MTAKLSDRLAARVASARRNRSAAPSRPPFYAIGVAAGLLLGGAAFLYGTNHPSNDLPPTPVITPEPVLAVEPAPPAPAPVSVAQAPVQPQRCVPYASNGTYLPELCGDHDAFSDRAERALAD